jgi:hypothetical protein
MILYSAVVALLNYGIDVNDGTRRILGYIWYHGCILR